MSATPLPATPVDPMAPVVATGAGSGADEPTPHDQPWAWHASRAAALLLVVLVPLHFAVTFVVADVGATTARSMSDRLADPTWRLLTWLTLALALVHATLSAVAALRRRRDGAGTTLLVAAVGVVAGALLATATWALFVRWV